MPFKNKEARDAYVHKWYLEHRAEAILRSREWKRSNNARARELNRQSAIKHRDKINARQRRYYKANRLRILARHKKYAHPNRLNATQTVCRAVKAGILHRPAECSQCRKPCKPQAHHHKGYARENWLSIQWLCHSCHGLAHAPPIRAYNSTGSPLTIR